MKICRMLLYQQNGTMLNKDIHPKLIPCHTRLFQGFDEDYVNDEENALTTSFSKSRNLEDITKFPSNFSVIKIN